MKMKNKKGEITTEHIVIISILIISFVILLFFVVQLNTRSGVDKQICRNSIVLASKVGVLGDAGKNNINCKVNYLCISGGQDCSGVTASETIKVDLTKDKVQTQEEIMKAIAEEMIDCWWMYGQGEIRYINRKILPSQWVCSACSKITFDDSIKKQNLNPINYLDFYRYLSSNQVEDKSLTYSEYLYSTNNIFSINEALADQYIPDYLFRGGDISSPVNRQISFDKNYYLFTGIGVPSKVDHINQALSLGIIKPLEDYYAFPVVLLNSDSLDDVTCTEYITEQ